MNMKKIATIIALILMLTIPLMAGVVLSPAGADTVIDITTSGSDVDLDITTGNGTLLTIDYEGRDLISEIAEKIKTIADLRQVIITLAMRNDIEDLEDQLAELEEALQKLIDELNLVLNDLYFKLGTQAHVIGINPGNTTVAITLISGNLTIADYLDGILVDLNTTEQVLISIQVQFDSVQSQFDNVYTGTMIHDELIMNGRTTAREMNTTFNARITDLTESFSEALGLIWATDVELNSQITFQNMDIEELRDELESTNNELRRTRDSMNNITIMFGLFALVVIGLQYKYR